MNEILKDINLYSDNDIINMIRANNMLCLHVKNPSEKVQKAMIEITPRNILRIENPSDDIKKLAIVKDPYIIQDIKEQTDELQLLAVKTDYRAISCIDNPCELVKEYIFKNAPTEIVNMKLVSDDDKYRAIITSLAYIMKHIKY